MNKNTRNPIFNPPIFRFLNFGPRINTAFDWDRGKGSSV